MGYFVYFTKVLTARRGKKIDAAKTSEENADLYSFFNQELERVSRRPGLTRSPLFNKNLRMYSARYYVDSTGNMQKEIVGHRTIPPDSPLTASQLKKIERLMKSGVPEN